MSIFLLSFIISYYMMINSLIIMDIDYVNSMEILPTFLYDVLLSFMTLLGMINLMK